jgi:multidrug efflux pump subunit AcrB
VILLFLGDWRMTVIAVLTIPIAVMASLIGLYASGNTINVMTLAGLSLAIGPMVDSAIICLENTHRHLGLGATPEEAAFRGASEVAMPELVASLCTLLVLAPLALMPGLGEFLYRPMAAGVAFAMISAYFLSRTFVPSRSASWLKAHTGHGHEPANGNGHDELDLSPEVADDRRAARRGMLRSIFARWESLIETGIGWYVRQLNRAMNFRIVVVLIAVGLFAATLGGLGTRLRREFFPEVDSGAFEMYARAASGTRIEETEKRIAKVEEFLRKDIGEDLQIIISELGVVADLSAAYTPNAGPMDAVIKVQLKQEREHSAQEYVERLRKGLARNPRFNDLEFAFDAGGMIRSAMNEGKSSGSTTLSTSSRSIVRRWLISG